MNKEEREKKAKLKTTYILKRRMLRDAEKGGINSLTVGPPGAGKTNQLVHDCKNIFKHHPKELVFWWDNPESAAQYAREGVEYEIFVEEGCNVSFRNLTDGGSLNKDYTVFSCFNDIVNMDTGKGLAKPQQINAIYFKNKYSLIDFISHLRKTIGFQSVFIDEIECIIPLNPPKLPHEDTNIRYQKNIEFSETAKEARKDLVNIFADTQDRADIDHRFIRKLNMIVYLSGSKVDKRSRVWESSVNNLPIGKGFVCYERSSFGKIRFDYYPIIKPVFSVSIS
jgi:hypothetical protein